MAFPFLPMQWQHEGYAMHILLMPFSLEPARFLEFLHFPGTQWAETAEGLEALSAQEVESPSLFPMLELLGL